MVRPQSASAGPIQGEGDRLSTSITFTATPVVQFGSRPEAAPTPLPALGSTGGETHGIHTLIEIVEPASSASAQLDRALHGRTMRVGLRSITVRSARVSVDGSRATIALNISIRGGLFPRPAGWIYLTGVPAYDPASRSLRIREPHFTVETVDRLRAFAGWVLRGPIEHRVSEKALFPIGARLDQRREQIEHALNRPLGHNASLTTRIDGLRPLAIGVRDDSLVARVVADGSAEIHVDVAGLMNSAHAHEPSARAQ
jgi:hypothetical protein